MNSEQKEEKKKINKIMDRYNIIRAVVLVGIVILFCILAINNKNNTETSVSNTQNPNEIVNNNNSYYDRFASKYKAFEGKEVDLSNIEIGELIVNEEGYNLFPYKSVDEMYEVFKIVRDKYEFKNDYMTIDQSREFNGLSGENYLVNINKIYRCDKDNESLEMYLESLGNSGDDCNRMAITIRAEGWDRVTNITTDMLKEMGVNNDLISAINESEDINGAKIKYSNSEDNVVISLTKKVSGVCELVLNIYNDTSNKTVDTIKNVSYETTDGVVAFPNLIKSDLSNDLSFEDTNKLFGKEVDNMFFIRTGHKFTDCEAKVRLKGSKLDNGYIVREETYFETLYKTDSDKYEVGLNTAYTDGSSSVTLFINKLGDEAITEEEREKCQEIGRMFEMMAQKHECRA